MKQMIKVVYHIKKQEMGCLLETIFSGGLTHIWCSSYNISTNKVNSTVAHLCVFSDVTE